MSAELDTAKDVAVFLAVGGFALKLWWDDREKKNAALEATVENTEKKAEQESATSVREANETLKRVEHAVARLQMTAEATSAGLAIVTGRVEGFSKDHGERLHVIEETLARQDERLKVVERRKGR